MKTEEWIGICLVVCLVTALLVYMFTVVTISDSTNDHWQKLMVAKQLATYDETGKFVWLKEREGK